MVLTSLLLHFCWDGMLFWLFDECCRFILSFGSGWFALTIVFPKNNDKMVGYNVVFCKWEASQ